MTSPSRTIEPAASSCARARRSPSPLAFLRSVCALVRLWRSRADERRLLMRMSERELRDLALTRMEVVLEYEKPFWRK
jgi:uncharacterized protein YjiS (DUF1127 family)